MTTKLKREATAAVAAWCKKAKLPAKTIRHVHPRAYVVGRAAPKCLIVAVPWQDSEPQCREYDKAHPLNTVYTFDDSLDVGMWCATAYVVRDGCQETVAVSFAV